MSNAIRESITETFGFEPICINSALVSAQNRNRLYWVGRRNLDGTYSRVKVEQPDDRGILLRDILDGVTDREKGRCVLGSIGRTTTREYFKKDQGTMAFEPVEYTVRKDSEIRVTENNIHGLRKNGATESESFVYFEDGKTNALTTGHIPRCISKIADPVRIPEYGIDGKSRCLTASYAYKGSGEGSLVSEAFPDNPNKQVRDYVAESIPVFATPCEWDESGKPTKAVSGTDGKTYLVYQVKDGKITIKGKQYPIKLADGFYIIRKLTVSECKRLQTVPEWYEFPVSDTQAYKMLGNGWTVEVIAHLIDATQANILADEQIDLFRMVGDCK